MSLIIILICIAVQRYLAPNLFRNETWLAHYAGGLNNLCYKLHLKNSVWSLLLFILPIVLVVATISYLLYDLFYNLFYFVFSICILFLCLDARNMHRQLSPYFVAHEHNDQQTIDHYATEFIGRPPSEDRVNGIREVTRTIFIKAELYVFSVLFWYILLGPTGAVLYALLRYLTNSAAYRAVAEFLLALMDYIPVRLTALAYALVGHFAFCLSHCKQLFLAGIRSTRELAWASGLAALELEPSDVSLADVEENKLALDLVDRAIVLWLLVIALLTITAWM
jgi:AmpE protein